MTVKRRGRPSKDDPRVKDFRLRLNKEESERLSAVSKSLGMSKADSLRKLMEDFEKNDKIRS